MACGFVSFVNIRNEDDNQGPHYTSHYSTQNGTHKDNAGRKLNLGYTQHIMTADTQLEVRP